MKIANIICNRYKCCAGCPGDHIEYTPDDMIQNGAGAIHLATEMVVGYPPFPRVSYCKKYLEEKYKFPTIIGTYPIPEKGLKAHLSLNTPGSKEWQKLIAPTLTNETLRLAYS